MQIIKQWHEILKYDNLKTIEIAGRTCYKSEDKITEESSVKFVKGLIKRRHTAMVEFGDATVKLITDRGVTHEQVRHRPVSYGQESTRFVEYDNITYIHPVWINSLEELDEAEKIWYDHMQACEIAYGKLIKLGWKPEQARTVLPNSLKTEIVVKTNYTEWRHIFNLRVLGTTGRPHPQIKSLLEPVLRELNSLVPSVFEDIVQALDLKYANEK